MFKKTKIAAVTAAVLGVSGMAIAPSAQAVSVNDGDMGQVLVFPYYNVNNGFITSFNITNTTDKYKAVKVRFRESKTSNDVLDFNVYMSPNDMWTMGLSADADGGVRLSSDDKTCTHPKMPEDGVAFRGAGIYDSVTNADEKEGYLEVIEMGEVDEDATVKVGEDDVLIAEGGLLHVDGTPKNCDVVELAWQQSVFIQGGAASNGDSTDGDIHTVHPKAIGYPSNAALGGTDAVAAVVDDLATPNVDETAAAIPSVAITESIANFYGTNSGSWTTQKGALNAPAGGLMGSGILIDLVNAAGFVYEPVATVNYSSVPQHYLSSDQNFYLLPSLASGDVAIAHNLANNLQSVVPTTWTPVARDIGLDDLNVLPRTSVPSGINPFPMAHAMAVTSISNEYVLTGEAKTDWVTTAPMKKHGIWNNFQYVAAADPTAFDKANGDIAIAPADATDDAAVAAATANGYWEFLDANDVESEFVYFDREEGGDDEETVLEPGDFSPPLATDAPAGTAKVPFSREVNVLALSDTGADSVLGSNNAQGLTLATGFDTGWGKFDFSAYDLSATRYTSWTTVAAGANLGVPLAGFAAIQGGNLGETFPHVLGRTR